MSQPRTVIESYLHNSSPAPLFVCGDALDVLRELPSASIDMCITSPPYWNKREYADGGIGLEPDYHAYIEHLLPIVEQIARVLRPSGSLWLNLGDTYRAKGLIGLPWRIALALIDQQGWTLRNDVIWNKIKGPDTARDRLRATHEYVFHFVRRASGFYYDIDAIRSDPRKTSIRRGAIVSATGVTGVRYRRQIELSTALSDDEKQAARQALDHALDLLRRGELSDFRMVLRQQQRTTHSASTRVSGRARELERKGFYVLRYHPRGSKPGDVWEILPEDTTARDDHYAAFPEDLCRIPLLATCPPDGVALDPFCGTGTTNLVAQRLGRRSIGIDISSRYIERARARCDAAR